MKFKSAISFNSQSQSVPAGSSLNLEHQNSGLGGLLRVSLIKSQIIVYEMNKTFEMMIRYRDHQKMVIAYI